MDLYKITSQVDGTFSREDYVVAENFTAALAVATPGVAPNLISGIERVTGLSYGPRLS